MDKNENQAFIILVNKPRGISSNSVVNIVKKALNAKKAGHLGTLDVEGEGLLPVTINKATILFDYFLNKDKTYQTVFEFGYTTDTLDSEGTITNKDNKVVTQKDIQQAIPKLIGKVSQMPPQYSAKKVNGKRAYNLARQGEVAPLKPKDIQIYYIKLLKQLKQNVFQFEISCSSGTYIRAIARDMAAQLSTYGVMQSILRTRCGNFDLSEAFTLEQIKNGDFKTIKLDTLFDFNKILLSKYQTERLLQGANVDFLYTDGLYRAYCQTDFLGILQIENGKGKFKYRFI